MRRSATCLTIVLLLLMLGVGNLTTPTDSYAQGLIHAITRNADWEPDVRIIYGAEMVLVPPGEFMMGSNNGIASERPAQATMLYDAFWIDRTEVTYGDFAALNGPAKYENGTTNVHAPRVNVTWFEANAHCQKRGARLATEREWEYAARGPDGLTYPWGNVFDPGRAIYMPNAYGQPAEVGSKPGGASWVGALDMSGNVYEWVSSLYRNYPYRSDDGRESVSDTTSLRGIRGGAYINDNEYYLRATHRNASRPENWSGYIGFRCAHKYEGGVTPSPTPTMAEAIPDCGARTILRNSEWRPINGVFDGVEMVCVPPGSVITGWNGETDTRGEASFHRPFWIDKYEVTNAQFNRLEGKASRLSHWRGDNQPRDQITWKEAEAFCKTRGGRLPTEAEWEYAARGPDSTLYPWGDQFDAGHLIFAENSQAKSANVGTKPGGESWIGAYDLSGNVWEWVTGEQSRRSSDPENQTDSSNKQVIRGGSYRSEYPSNLTAAKRFHYPPESSKDDLGFRCVRAY